LCVELSAAGAREGEELTDFFAGGGVLPEPRFRIERRFVGAGAAVVSGLGDCAAGCASC
jgi:hypothetical protein